MNKQKKLFLLLYVTSILLLIFSRNAFADDGGQVIKIGNLDNVFNSILKTLQFYTPFLLALLIGWQGIKLITSSDDSSARAEAVRHIIAMSIGGVLIWGAATIASNLMAVVK